MARRIGWTVNKVIEMNDKAGNRWFLVEEVAEQGRTRIRASRANVGRLKGKRGEVLTQLQLPLQDAEE